MSKRDLTIMSPSRESRAPGSVGISPDPKRQPKKPGRPKGTGVKRGALFADDEDAQKAGKELARRGSSRRAPGSYCEADATKSRAGHKGGTERVRRLRACEDEEENEERAALKRWQAEAKRCHLEMEKANEARIKADMARARLARANNVRTNIFARE